MRATKLCAITICLICVLLGASSSSVKPHPEEPAGSDMMTGARALLADYKEWEARYVENGGDRNVVVAMGWYAGLSTEKTKASGSVKLNLVDGVVSAEVTGLPRTQTFDLWLIDNGPGSTVLPEAGDAMKRVGTFKQRGKVAKVEARLGERAFAEYDPDLFVVSRTGMTPVESRLIVGTTTFFNRLYRSGQRGQFGLLADAEPLPTTPQADEEPGLWTKLKQALFRTAHAELGTIPDGGGGGEGGSLTPLDQLINQGRFIFLNEQFNGNGRTCGTCHREDNNLTIDPEFIATLPPNDALFVAEFDPNLAQNFENPALMRKFGLILENLDGFDDLANKFVMRGVPHTLALLQNTLTPAGFDGTTQPPNERTGWSGDGAPVGTFILGNGTTHQALGTLRDFAIGAVIQHFTRTLNRVPGFDFRLPTNAELDALNAFQRSTGRRQDLNLNTLRLKSEVAERGRVLFISTGVFGQPAPGLGRCNACHLNAGASVNGVNNANFNTGVEGLPDQPADLTGEPNPPDGGFGSAPNPGGGFGNGTFNTPVLVEAGDTGPFFHNNTIRTIEGTVSFYDSAAFNSSPAGAAIGGIDLEPTQIEAISALLRVINALENIRSSTEIETRARNAKFLSDAVDLLRLSISELEDAVDALACGSLHPEAIQKLRRAIELDQQALTTNSRSTRQSLIDQAIALKNGAVNDLRL